MIRFLQISDIHFTDITGNDDEYKLMKSKFLEDIEECKRLVGKVDRILICGDIAFAGMDTQYKEAREFIDNICKRTECGDVLLVPGNHDKKWDVYSRARQMMRETLLKGKSTKLLLESKVKEPMAVGILLAPFKQYYKLALDYTCISDMALIAAGFPESDQEMDKMRRTVNVLFFQALLAHTCQPALRIFAEPILNLCTHGLCQAGTLNLTGWILRLTGQTHVNTVFRICLRQSLVLRDVALDSLPADTNSAGYLPLTQTINAMVMENLFFLVHVYLVLTNYTITALF